MSYKFEELKGKQYVVHVPTKELAYKVENILGNHLARQSSGYTNTFWKEYKEETCYMLSCSGYCQRSYFQKEGFIIISAEDFIRDNTVEKPKTFQVDGTPNLIKAFIRELKELGYKMTNEERETNIFTSICSNLTNPDKLPYYIEIFIETTTIKNPQREVNFSLPTQYNEALQFCKEAINSPYWKIQEELPTISGYKTEKVEGGLKWGCQTILFQNLEAYKDLLSRKEFKASITINDIPITSELLTKLLKLK